jgi:hypothetical protein
VIVIQFIRTQLNSNEIPQHSPLFPVVYIPSKDENLTL